MTENMERGVRRPQNKILNRTHMRTPMHIRRLLTAAFFFPSLFFPAAALAASDVMVGEVAWAGSAASKADEWIELWNLGDTPYSLAGHVLIGASKALIAFPENAVIPPKHAYLIANYDADDERTALRTVPDLVTSSLSLSNTALDLALLNPASSTVDALESGAPPAGAGGDAPASMIRTPDGWMTASLSANMDPTDPSRGTPGVCDLCIHMSFLEETTDSKTEDRTSSEPVSDPTTDMTETEIVDAPHPATSSTESVVTPEPENTTPTATMIASTSTRMDPETADHAPADQTAVPSEEPPVVRETPTITNAPTRYDLLRLNEAMPNPEEGAEWIEITAQDLDTDIPLAGVTIHDAVTKIHTFGDTTLSAANPIAVVKLSSARLNNGGDTIIIRDPDGNDLEVFTYDGSEKGLSWARSPDGTGSWHVTTVPTPGRANVITPLMTEEKSLAEPDNEITPSALTGTDPGSVSGLSDDAGTETIEKTDSESESGMTKAAEPVRSLAVLSKSKAPKKTASAPKKTSAKKNTDFIRELSIDMTHHEEFAGIRVRLHGTVGSMPGLVNGHAFILLSPTGRGIRVSVPSTKKLPAMDTGVAVTGQLTYASNDIPYLKMSAKDSWFAEENALPMSRETNLADPLNEDAWSLVTVEGTVGNVTSHTISLDRDGREIAVSVKDSVGYRVSRLVKGDVVQVVGLLELTSDGARVLPRTADDLTILAHAAPVAPVTKKTSIPGWVPFGAAGLAVAGTEGYKRVQSHRKRRKLERVLTEKEPELV